MLPVLRPLRRVPEVPLHYTRPREAGLEEARGQLVMCDNCEGTGSIENVGGCTDEDCCSPGWDCYVCNGEGEIPDEEDQQPSAA